MRAGQAGDCSGTIWGQLKSELLPDSSGMGDGLRWPQAAHRCSAGIHWAEPERGVCHGGDTGEQPALLSPLFPPAFSGLERGKRESGS